MRVIIRGSENGSIFCEGRTRKSKRLIDSFFINDKKFCERYGERREWAKRMASIENDLFCLRVGYSFSGSSS